MEWMTLPLKKYAQFTGRSRRKEYWMFVLLYVIVLVVASILDSIIFGRPALFYGLVVLGFIVPMIACGIRRLHDTNRSGWFMLLGLVPIANIVLLVFLCTEGTRGPNQYGPDPK